MTIDILEADIPSPVGKLRLQLIEGKLAAIHFLPATAPKKPAPKKIIQSIAAEIQKYFTNPRHRIHLATHPLQGTDFQKSVWQALQKIPCGKTLSYQALAQQLKTSPRAIGNACRRNPLPLLIPCHRVVAKSGLGGFSGAKEGRFVKIKQALLEHESSPSPGGRE